MRHRIAYVSGGRDASDVEQHVIHLPMCGQRLLACHQDAFAIEVGKRFLACTESVALQL